MTIDPPAAGTRPQVPPPIAEGDGVHHWKLTEVERRLWQAFSTGAALDLRPPPRSADKRPSAASHPTRTVRGAVLAAMLTRPRPERAGAPVLRLTGATVTGELDLEAAEVHCLVELAECSFENPPNLQLAHFAGLHLARCALPGLRGHNLHVRSELVLTGAQSTDTIEIVDAHIEGSLQLSDAVLASPGDDALHADRVTTSGAVVATGLRASAKIRLPGGRIGGNVDLRGAELVGEPDALDARGMQVGGNLRLDRGTASRSGPFRSAGRLVLVSARVEGDAMFSGALLGAASGAEPGVLVLPRGAAEGSATLVADRIRVGGNLELDEGFAAEATVRLPHARIEGYLRLSGATLGSPEWLSRAGDHLPVALLGDGMRIGGDLEARAALNAKDAPPGDRFGPLLAHGQVRLSDAGVAGSAGLTGAFLHAPDLDALFADRLRIGGTLFLRRVVVSGSLRLHNAWVGSSMDCTAAVLDASPRRPTGSDKPSLDARALTIGKDLLCSRGFTAPGGVRLRLAEVSKSVNFGGSRLGGIGTVALNLQGLVAEELVLRFAAPPSGDVRLARARVTSLFDSEPLWQATGRLEVEDFSYTAASADPQAGVRDRLRWLRAALVDYDPDPYETLAASYRDAGYDHRCDLVLLAKQRHRHAALGPAGRVWGRIQEWTVGYGYRPWLAAGWLALFWLLGGVWFSFHQLQRLSTDQNPAWDPWLYAADLVIPVVNLGEDGLWRTEGASAWVAGALIALGWVLASTVAAGVARVLKRG